jgi:hypothetical protein
MWVVDVNPRRYQSTDRSPPRTNLAAFIISCRQARWSSESAGIVFERASARPVLPNGIESQADWDARLATLEEALQPVGSWEKLCVYRIALSAWKHFRLVRHEAAIISAAILKLDNEFKSTHDEDYVSTGDVSEVIHRSESSLGEEMFQQRDFMLRVDALAGEDFSDITFTAAERRKILTAIIKQPVYDADGSPTKIRIPKKFLEGLDAGDGFSGEDDDDDQDDDLVGYVSDDGEDTNDVAADNEDAVVILAAQLRKEIDQIAGAKCVDTNEANRLQTRPKAIQQAASQKLRANRTGSEYFCRISGSRD